MLLTFPSALKLIFREWTAVKEGTLMKSLLPQNAEGQQVSTVRNQRTAFISLTESGG